jgi:hypothetical protein
MNKQKKIDLRLVVVVAMVIIALALTVTTFAAITNSQKISSTGSVNVSPNLGVFSDSACTVSLNNISWGNITAGTNVQRTIYIKNISNGCSLTLNMMTSNWSFTNNENMTLTWNQEGSKLNPGASTSAVLTLAVSPDIVDITTFSIQISIIGTN